MIKCLSKGDYDSTYLGKQVKPMVHELTTSKGQIILSIDDSIEEKRYTDQSEIICWHYDHVFSRSLKGINFLTALVDVGGAKLPVSVEFVRKDLWELDEKKGKPKRKSSKTKNELLREMITGCHTNFHFDYAVADSWYSSIENMKLIKKTPTIFCTITLYNDNYICILYYASALVKYGYKSMTEYMKISLHYIIINTRD